MNHLLAVLLALSSTAAFGGGYASRPVDDPGHPGTLEGLYAGVGAAATMMIFADNAYGGASGELRIGYSFNPSFQLYLSGVLDSTIAGDGPSFKAEQVVVYVQYHLLVKPAVMIYGRAGIGVGISGDFAQDIAGNSITGVGLAAGGGLGAEIRLGAGLYFAPEFFYRSATLSGQGLSASYQVAGLGLNLIYY